MHIEGPPNARWVGEAEEGPRFPNLSQGLKGEDKSTMSRGKCEIGRGKSVAQVEGSAWPKVRKRAPCA